MPGRSSTLCHSTRSASATRGSSACAEAAPTTMSIARAAVTAAAARVTGSRLAQAERGCQPLRGRAASPERRPPPPGHRLRAIDDVHGHELLAAVLERGSDGGEALGRLGDGLAGVVDDPPAPGEILRRIEGGNEHQDSFLPPTRAGGRGNRIVQRYQSRRGCADIIYMS